MWNVTTACWYIGLENSIHILDILINFNINKLFLLYINNHFLWLLFIFAITTTTYTQHYPIYEPTQIIELDDNHRSTPKHFSNAHEVYICLHRKHCIFSSFWNNFPLQLQLKQILFSLACSAASLQVRNYFSTNNLCPLYGIQFWNERPFSSGILLSHIA